MKLLNKQVLLYPESKKYIDDFNSLLNQLISLKQDKISAKGNPPMPLVVWKLKSYAQTTLHRIIDLSIESCNAWDNNLPAVSFLLTRSVLESVSYIFDFTNQMIPSEKAYNLEEINSIVNKLKYGGKGLPKLPKIDNVLTIMDRISKIIPGYREDYEKLSSFCHPNYAAVGMLYSKQDMEEFCFNIDRKNGIRPDTFNIIVIFLYKSLTLQKLSMERLETIYPKLVELDALEYKKLNGA